MLEMIGGMKIITNPLLTETELVWLRKYRSTKKRNVKKFRKKYTASRTIPAPYAVVMGDSMMMHPLFAQQLRNELMVQNKTDLQRAALLSTPMAQSLWGAGGVVNMGMVA